jgi:hypothetical protein
MNWFDVQLANDIAKERIDYNARRAEREAMINWPETRAVRISIFDWIGRLWEARKAQTAPAGEPAAHRMA